MSRQYIYNHSVARSCKELFSPTLNVKATGLVFLRQYGICTVVSPHMLHPRLTKNIVALTLFEDLDIV